MYTVRHITHVTIFSIYLYISIIDLRVWHYINEFDTDYEDPWTTHGALLTILIHMLHFFSLMALPHIISNHIGLIAYDTFDDHVSLNANRKPEFFLCLRIATRGLYPELVRRNIASNIDTCHRVGLRNFMVEVVTEKFIGFPANENIREIVVPKLYVTKSGALFKARALQYCLEENINILKAEDWIVHLDEETLMSDDSVRGIMNFCSDGKHDFGQGVIFYAHGQVVNWMTTLMDSYRVADDLGRLRFYLKYFNKTLSSWKGSYIVSRCASERTVSFDHGPDGSVTEDIFFSLVAQSRYPNFTFGFIDGPMYEQSPFSWWDYVQQRKRWYQGSFLSIRSSAIQWRRKLLLACMFSAWSLLPLNVLFGIMGLHYPLPFGFDVLTSYMGTVSRYVYAFGIYKSLMSRNRCPRFLYCLVLIFLVTFFLVPFTYFVESVVVLWGIFGRKHTFYIVQTESQILLTYELNNCGFIE